MGKARPATLTADEIHKLCEEAVDSGISKYISAVKQEKEEHRSRLRHNTKKLLENYRRFKAYIEKTNTTLKDVAAEEYPGYSPELLEVFGIRIEDSRSYSMARSVATMTLLMNHVDRMLEAYKNECLSSENEVSIRRWNVIDKMYISGEKRTTAKALADEYSVDLRVIQDDAKKAREDLRVIIFGMDALIDDLSEETSS